MCSRFPSGCAATRSRSPAASADRREPDDEEQAEPEVRHAQPDQRARRRDVVLGPAAPDGGDHPRRNPDDDRDDEAEHRDLDRDRIRVMIVCATAAAAGRRRGRRAARARSSARTAPEAAGRACTYAGSGDQDRVAVLGAERDRGSPGSRDAGRRRLRAALTDWHHQCTVGFETPERRRASSPASG